MKSQLKGMKSVHAVGIPLLPARPWLGEARPWDARPERRRSTDA